LDFEWIVQKKKWIKNEMFNLGDNVG
jgi:hypothetical protein